VLADSPANEQHRCAVFSLNVKQRRMFCRSCTLAANCALVGNTHSRRGRRSYKVSFFEVTLHP